MGESFANFSKRLTIQLHSLDVQSVKVSWLRGIIQSDTISSFDSWSICGELKRIIKERLHDESEDRADRNRRGCNIKSYSQKGFFSHLRWAPRTSVERKI